MYHSPIRALKQQYRPLLVKAQRKYRRFLKEGSNNFEFQEAQQTGGQFSFRTSRINGDVGNFFKELARIRTFLNMEPLNPKDFVSSAQARSEPYAEIFKAENSLNDRFNLGYDDTYGPVLFQAYRRLREEGDIYTRTGKVFDSGSFLAYLYSYAVEGYDAESLQRLGETLLNYAAYSRVEQHATDVPVPNAEQNRDGSIVTPKGGIYG